jgi:hypothetical protein
LRFLFVKGVLLKDANGILTAQTENVQAGRQVRFTNVRDVVGLGPVLKAYIHEAVDAENAGLKVDYKKTSEFAIPEEFQKRLRETRPEDRFRGVDPGSPKSLHPLFFIGQAVQDAGIEGREIPAPRFSREKVYRINRFGPRSFLLRMCRFTPYSFGGMKSGMIGFAEPRNSERSSTLRLTARGRLSPEKIVDLGLETFRRRASCAFPPCFI